MNTIPFVLGVVLGMLYFWGGAGSAQFERLWRRQFSGTIPDYGLMAQIGLAPKPRRRAALLWMLLAPVAAVYLIGAKGSVASFIVGWCAGGAAGLAAHYIGPSAKRIATIFSQSVIEASRWGDFTGVERQKMGLFSSLRIAKWQTRVAARISICLEESQGVRLGRGYEIDADEMARTLVRLLHQAAPSLLGDPKSGTTGSLMPTVACALACGLTPEWTDHDKKYIKKALEIALSEASDKDTRRPIDQDLLAEAQKVLDRRP